MPVDTPAQLKSLTPFDLEVLQDKACGLTDEQVGAKRNNISSNTVKGWLRVIYDKLGYHDKTKEAEEIRIPAARAACTVLRAGKIVGPYKGSVVPDFTREELSILDLVSLGYTTNQISGYFPFGEERVKSHLKSAGEKCGTASRIQIAATAIVYKLI